MVSTLAKVFRRESLSSHDEVSLRQSSPEVENTRRRRSSFFNRFSIRRKSSRSTQKSPVFEPERGNNEKEKIELLLTEIKMLENANRKYYNQMKEETERRILAENELHKVLRDVDRIVREHQDLHQQVRLLRMVIDFDEKKRELLQKKQAFPMHLRWDSPPSFKTDSTIYRKY
ncbi:hypothetical protein L596_007419 [Steinernema carpocapsae]|uniref:Uncharacterized protein n=1 Tax=Steinernema carpocapsae TaxID=34508 RepID=A0A4U5P9M8_STECR|nr:hypothetical protein L596_007419 [Steinernema carpocapsae]